MSQYWLQGFTFFLWGNEVEDTWSHVDFCDFSIHFFSLILTLSNMCSGAGNLDNLNFLWFNVEQVRVVLKWKIYFILSMCHVPWVPDDIFLGRSRINVVQSPLVTGVGNLISIWEISSEFELGHWLDTPMSIVRCSQSGPLLYCSFPADMGVSNRWPSSNSELISHMEMRLCTPVTRGYFFPLGALRLVNAASPKKMPAETQGMCHVIYRSFSVIFRRWCFQRP